LRCALVLITHDRRFLQEAAGGILELDRGHLTRWDGDYRGYLAFRERELAAEERANAEFDRRLSEEERWIRQGIKARRTRNEGRVRALKAMRDERRARRERTGTATLRLDDAQRSGRIVCDLREVGIERGGKPVLEDVSLLVQRGDRIGIVGPNGAGKSTLLGLVTGTLEADTGSVTLGSKLEIAYADQLRSDAGPGKEPPRQRLRWPVLRRGRWQTAPRRILSRRLPVSAAAPAHARRGALRRRAEPRRAGEAVHAARQPADPRRADQRPRYRDPGTARGTAAGFLGNGAAGQPRPRIHGPRGHQPVVLRGDGRVEEQAGGFSDWEARGGTLSAVSAVSAVSAAAAPRTATSAAGDPPRPREARPRKLSYREQRELDGLPAEVDRLEGRQAELEAQTAQPDFYGGDHREVQATLDELAEVHRQLEALLERWTELEERA
jgi:ATP-binding cassette subfamily F protein uup